MSASELVFVRLTASDATFAHWTGFSRTLAEIWNEALGAARKGASR